MPEKHPPAPSVHPERLQYLNKCPGPTGPVLYWMSRDQRAVDNWALFHAQQVALLRRVPLAVVFCMPPAFLGATWRAYAFMLKGLAETERALHKLAIPFFLVRGNPADALPALAARVRASLIVTDFDPLRIKLAWRAAVASAARCPVVEVDAHNIVPARHASPKQEFGAYTLRPKLRRLLPHFLAPMPDMRRHPHRWPASTTPVDWPSVHRSLDVDRRVGEVNWLTPGTAAGLDTLRLFIADKLCSYHDAARDPTRDGLSNLSPYLHFGQVSAQRVALEINVAHAPAAARESFLEELIVRRELSDNFCLFNPSYDSPAGFPAWATRTLSEHTRDTRPYLYPRERLENADTHDPLWNAAQMEMVKTGKMHGYMRMYWAKKILEWTPTIEEALHTTLELNDRYELDGRDPNGYVGAAWSIGGVHDRAWGERPVFGKIRYMSYNGCKSKFDVAAYIESMTHL